jgi:hypothetical protein
MVTVRQMKEIRRLKLLDHMSLELLDQPGPSPK